MYHCYMSSKEKILLLGIVIAVMVIVLDQLSKFLMLTFVLNEQSVIIIMPFFNLVHAWNTGVSFSLFNNGGVIGTLLLCLIVIVIVAILLRWLYKEKTKLIQIALGMIIGGAVGNLIDRIRFGAVFDFLDFYIDAYHWPAFNLADSCICIGAVMIILHSMIYPTKKQIKEQK